MFEFSNFSSSVKCLIKSATRSANGNDVLQYVSVCCMGSWHPFIDTATGKLLEIWR